MNVGGGEGYGPMDLTLELCHVADGHHFRVR